jgi:hypothetical protein
MNKPKSSSLAQEKKTKEELRRQKTERQDKPIEPDEDTLDQTIEDSFPASDPPSSIPNPDEDAA